jgi:hypothetical protein
VRWTGPIPHIARKRAPERMSSLAFSALARAHAASLAGDAFVTVALAGSLFFAAPVGSARPNVALYLLVTMTPFAFVAPLLGPLLDRAHTRRTFVAAGSCAARVVLALLIARHISGFLVYPEAFAIMVALRAFLVAKSALVGAVITDEDALVGANSRLSVVGVVGGLIGGAAAVGILKLGSASWVLVGAACVYAVAAWLSLRIPVAVRDDVPVTEEAAPVRVSGIRAAAIGMAALRGAVGFLVFLFAFALKDNGEPAWVYGGVVAASALGGLAGAIAAPRLRRLVREEAVLVLSIALPAALAVVGARSEARLAWFLVSFALGLGSTAGRAGFDALVQRDAPDTEWGRSFARYEALFQVTWVAGGLVPVILHLSSGTGLIFLALGLGAGGFLYLGALAADSLLGKAPSGA